MSEHVLVRNDVTLTDQQREALRAGLFGMVDGLSVQGKKAWRRLWNRVDRLEPGEIFTIESKIQRHGPFHRRHMLIETRLFQAQERIKTFQQFRLWLKLGAGFVDWMPGPKGGVVPVPRSIDYVQCDEETMRQFHDDLIVFLREPHAAAYLWKHLSPARAAEMMEAVLVEFDE